MTTKSRQELGIEIVGPPPVVLSDVTPEELAWAERNANKAHEPATPQDPNLLIAKGHEMADDLHENFTKFVDGGADRFSAYLCNDGPIHQAATARLKSTIISHQTNQVRFPKDLKPDEEADGVQLIWLSGRRAVQLRAVGPNRYFESTELSRRQRAALLLTWALGRHRS